MPFVRHWPFYLSRRVLDDRRAAMEELERASGDLKDTATKALRTMVVADSLSRARDRNGFSEGMEALFAQSRLAHHPKGRS